MFPQGHQGDEDNDREDGEETVAVMHHAEGRPRVVDMGEVEKAGKDRHGFLKADPMDDDPLAGLIGKEEKNNHPAGHRPGDHPSRVHAAKTAPAQRPQSVGCSAWEPTSSR